MYVRFVVPEHDDSSRVESGIFRVVGNIMDDSSQPEWLRALLREQVDWFNSNLPVPDRLWLSFTRRETLYGVCWFRPCAQDVISRARTIQWLMIEADHLVQDIYTDAPGTILYRDNWQVVAKAGDHIPRGFH